MGRQLKWLLYAVALSAATTTLNTLGILGAWGGAVDNLVALGIPVAIGIALLRYRLYDIDRLINRTLVYGALTAILGLGYAIVVIVLGQLLGQDTGLAVAGATLAMAALFQPLRRRIQTGVDRRFNRRRHDAAMPSRPSPPTFATRSTWTPCARNWLPWSTRPWSRPGCRCGRGSQAPSTERADARTFLAACPGLGHAGHGRWPGEDAPSARAASLTSSAALRSRPGCHRGRGR